MTRAIRQLVGLASLAIAACAAEQPPSAPGTPERRAVVVAAQRPTYGPDGVAVRPPACDASCPAPRDGEQLAGCHAAELERGPRGDPLGRGAPAPEWVVCYFQVR